MSRINIGQAVPALADIANANSVYRLVLELREKARKPSSQFDSAVRRPDGPS